MEQETQVDDVLTKIVEASRTPEERLQADRTTKLAESSRVWNVAFGSCGGAVGTLAPDLPIPFLVETLARARLHDRIALVCDGAECGLMTHALKTIQSMCGSERAEGALRAYGEMVAEDRAAQAKARLRMKTGPRPDASPFDP